MEHGHGMPFDFWGGCISASSSGPSRSSAEGTAADAAAPAAETPCEDGDTSLVGHQHVHTRNKGHTRPFYLKARHAWFGIHIPDQPFKHDLLRRSLLHLVVVILGVLVISYADEFLVFVRAGEYECGDTEDVLGGYFGRVGWDAFKVKGVDADGDGSHETVVQFLIELFVSRRRDVDESPFEVWCGVSSRTWRYEGWRFTVLERCDALERDAEFVRVEKARGVVEKLDVLLSGQCFSRVVVDGRTRIVTMDMSWVICYERARTRGRGIT